MMNILTIVIFFIWSANIIYSYGKIIKSINIFKVKNKHLKILRKNNKKTKSILRGRSNRKSKILYKLKDFVPRWRLKRFINQYNISSQIIIQILISKIKYNLPKDLSNSIDEYLEIQTEFIKGIHNRYYEEVIALRLFDLTVVLYETSLENNNLLLSKISENLRPEDTEKILSHYNEIVPGVFQINKSIFEIELNGDAEILTSQVTLFEKRNIKYYKNLYNALTILSINNHPNLYHCLTRLVNQSNQSHAFITATNIFTIYFSLIYKSVMENDVKKLTTIINLAFNLVRSESDLYSNKQIVDGESFSYKIDQKSNSLAKIIILGIVKSIEMGHYGCAGYLIKVGVSQFDTIDFNSNCFEVHRVLTNRKVYDEKIITSLNINIKEPLLKELDFNFNISPTSFKYCFSKAAFLMHLQEYYINDLGVKKIPLSGILDITELIEDTNIEYLINKVQGLHKEYGLSFLKDDRILGLYRLTKSF
ncbi:hypothetical protein ACW2QC_07375 [Virgibacillus sp. FSP13]